MESNSPQIIPLRSKRKRWISNERIDAKIRQIYAERRDKRIHHLPSLKAFAKEIAWPHWAIKARARQMGLVRTKEVYWSDDEVRLLERYAHLSNARIQIKLKKDGFHRTEMAIHLKMARMEIRQAGGYYSAWGLAKLMGVDSGTVVRWIGLKYLKGERRGTARTSRQGGDAWLIREPDVKKFVLDHPMEFDMRKVTDQLWFLDLVTDGKVCLRS